MSLRHRIFLVPTREDLDVDSAIDHWEQRHGSVFAATPDLAGYVQHRPTRAEQHRLGGRVCAEALFTDRDAEARAWASSHYRETVTADEERFVDRSRAWAARVLAEHVLGAGGPARDRGLEVVALGTDPAGVPAGADGRILDVDRAGPTGGPAHVVILHAADGVTASSLADGLEADVVFVATRAAVLPLRV